MHVLLEVIHTTTPDADIGMTVCTDSDAARGMIHSVGCGRVRHLPGISKLCAKDISSWFAVARKRIRVTWVQRSWTRRQ